jgi:hypothetical protein
MLLSVSVRPIEESTWLAAVLEMSLKSVGEGHPDLLLRDLSHLGREIIPTPCAGAIVGKVSGETLDLHQGPETFSYHGFRDLRTPLSQVDSFARILRGPSYGSHACGTRQLTWAACPSTVQKHLNWKEHVTRPSWSLDPCLSLVCKFEHLLTCGSE